MPFLKGSWITNTNAAQPASEQIEPDVLSSSPEKPSEQATPDEQKQQPDGLVPPSPLSPSCGGTSLDRESCEKKSGKNVYFKTLYFTYNYQLYV